MTDATRSSPNETAWLARLAHDLRNQLAPMRTATQLLRDARLHEARRAEMLELVERQVQRMVRMLDDLSEYAHLRAGHVRPRRQVDLGFVVDAALSGIGTQLREARVTLDERLPDSRIRIECDQQRLTAALLRVLDNAIRATPAGGTVMLQVGADQHTATIRVQDTGRGIAPDRIERLFDLPDGPHGGEGLGISLYLARACARDHGGDLVAHSEGEGRGAVLVLTVPLGGGQEPGGTQS